MNTFNKGDRVRLMRGTITGSFSSTPNLCGIEPSLFKGKALGRVVGPHAHDKRRVYVRFDGRKSDYWVYLDMIDKIAPGRGDRAAFYKVFIGSEPAYRVELSLGARPTRAAVAKQALGPGRRKATGTLSCIKTTYDRREVVLLNVTEDGPPLPGPAKVRAAPKRARK